MRRRLIKNASNRIAKHGGLVIFEPQLNKGCWNEVFGNQNPIHLEIGMGKGLFLLKMAMKYPHINFVGIEKFDSVMVIAVEKIANHNLPNLKLIKADAQYLDTFFKNGEVDVIYLNFSDPWPKNRHEKRRLTSSNFLNRFKNIIKPSGFIELKTDNPNFFEYSIISMALNHWIIIDISLDLHKRHDEIITTEYEERFIALGQPIYYVKIKKEE